MGIDYDLSMLYSGYRLYEQHLEEERVQRRDELIKKLQFEKRESAFVSTLEHSRNTSIPPVIYNNWKRWFSSLDPVEKEYEIDKYLYFLNLKK